MGRVEALSLGGLQLQEVLTSYPEESPFSALFKVSGRQGSLGAEVLGRTTLILDYPREVFFVRKGATFYDPFEFDMSGLVVKKALTKEKRWYIGEVREGSPAYQAGILPFDELLSINSVPLAFWELEELFKLLRSEEGREIQLELRRYVNNDLSNFSDFKTSFPLKKQL
jgi:membrane-associated protease RseP (regulator of RpoE activity)